VAGAFTFLLEPLEPSNIRLQPSLGGGSLLDVGCYPVFGIRWVFGAEPVRVFAAARYEHGVDVEMNGMLWLADGRVGTFDCGFTLPSRQWLEITGTRGVVTVCDMWIPQPRAAFSVEHGGRPAEKLVLEGENQMVHMLDDFARAVFQKEPVQPSPVEAVRTLRVLDALARSAREGRPVDVGSS
jgi:predicted dehydrogenase